MGHTAPISRDISVIITAHSEGRLAHRSVRSARRAIRLARQRGARVELIAVLDLPSGETLEYFEAHARLFDLVVRVDFRDRGLARNHGAAFAAGRHLAFLDAADLWSENWLDAAFGFAAENKSPSLVLHPASSLHFGHELLLVSHPDSTDADYAPLDFIEFNPWTALNFVARDFFLSGNQYIATDVGRGFGHADWWWNCETEANGAVHRVVPETVHFIRQKDDALLGRLPEHARAVFPPTKLFSDAAARSRAGASDDGDVRTRTGVESATAVGTRVARRLRPDLPPLSLRIKIAGHRLLGSRPHWLRFYKEVVAAWGKVRLGPPPSPPRWLVAEWRRINEIETELFPSDEDLKNLVRLEPPKTGAARHYPELSALFSPAPTHVFLVPWLRPGGAEIESIYYMTAVAKENDGSRVVCLVTEDADSPWRDMLPNEITVVEFGKLLSGSSEDVKARLLSRLLLQESPGVIHNINSALGYKLFVEHGLALVARSNLFATMFAEEIFPNGKISGYGFTHLPFCIDYLSGIFTDNRRIINKLCETFAFAEERFTVVYAPAPANPKSSAIKSDGASLNVLWAGRLDVEKRPDVLIRIASELTGLPIHFHVYGAPVFNPQGPEVVRRLEQLPNVTFYGRYHGFESIPANLYDVFLYTSERDGLPNVLLEAIAAGLPVIAPDVGGIKELINEATGFLASRADAVEECVGYLKEILGDRLIVAPKIEAARELVKTRHSWASFISRLEQTPGYFAGAANDQPLYDEVGRLNA